VPLPALIDTSLIVVQRVNEEEEDHGGSDYNGDHLAAVMKPVCLTMALACLVVVNIREKTDDEQLSSGMRYRVVTCLCVMHDVVPGHVV
jgi:hypothetical protein